MYGRNAAERPEPVISLVQLHIGVAERAENGVGAHPEAAAVLYHRIPPHVRIQVGRARANARESKARTRFMRIITGVLRARRGAYFVARIRLVIPCTRSRNGIADEEAVPAVIQLDAAFRGSLVKCYVIATDAIPHDGVGGNAKICAISIYVIVNNIPRHIR